MTKYQTIDKIKHILWENGWNIWRRHSRDSETITFDKTKKAYIEGLELTWTGDRQRLLLHIQGLDTASPFGEGIASNRADKASLEKVLDLLQNGYFSL